MHCLGGIVLFMENIRIGAKRGKHAKRGRNGNYALCIMNYALVAFVLVFAMVFPSFTVFASQPDGGADSVPVDSETVSPPPSVDATEPPPGSFDQLPSPSPTPTPRPFPEWFNRLPYLPEWIYMVDELPEWFYQLERPPVWFYDIPRVPSWFYQITEIPEWFYPEEGPEVPDGGEGSDYWEHPPGWEDGKGGSTPFDREGTEDWERPEYWDPSGELEWPDPPDDPGDVGNGENIREPEEPVSHYDSSIYPFVYKMPGDYGLFASSVPFGMITDGGVRIDYPPIYIRILRGEDEYNHSPGEQITQDGVYTAITLGGDTVFWFRIITAPVNDLSAYPAPSGFYLQEVSSNHRTETMLNSDLYEVEEDGIYRFSLADKETGELFRVVTVTLDTTPPTLTFDGWEEGEVRTMAPVRYFPDELDAIVTVTKDGQSFFSAQDTLEEAGRYIITVTDLAGNETVYSFRLTAGMNISAIWVIIIFVLLLAALAVFLIRNRRKARVR